MECSQVGHESFKDKIIELKHLKFTKTSPTSRETTRIVPEEEYTVALFIKEFEIPQQIKIADISLNAVRLSLESLPPGLRGCKDIYLVLSLVKDSIQLETQADIFRIEEVKNRFDIVLMFEKKPRMKFMKYITSRQMAIIREFKGMQNER